MLAAVIHSPGGPDQLRLEQRPVPTASPGWVLIRIKAIGLNRSELFTRQGHSPVTFPRILGIEATGLVEAAPGGEFAAGDVVVTALGGMGREFDGSYAEFCCVRAERCQRIVCDLPWEVLGACGEMLQTAYGGLFDALRMKEGETLLVRGGTTSVGLAAAAIARSRGIHVASTTRRVEREKLLLENGADMVVIDDGEIAEQVREKTGGGVNKVLELIGTTTLLDSLRCAKKHGIVCMVGMVGDSKSPRFLDGSDSISTLECCPFEPMAAIPSSVSLTIYADPDGFTTTPLQALVEEIEAGKLKVTVGKTFKLEDIVEAHRTMDENRAGGKIVVMP
ncbi:hypothetical protein D0869_02414 [Hortaea werneckii]|uniref:Enoyl reductase (ER) domain-containing protein n=1 Tax=Hortaea werneckii TaxID=91943 RepID=A0A3M6YQ77_HORWE|nr:hypothetical protein D0869_02414 [Hortaea werneckii]RMY05224.1 hypothetical protein D0868_06527 [Hortaea werneckii]